MSRTNFPAKRTAARNILESLLADGPGTFYQLCERCRIDCESARDERIQRELFARLERDFHIELTGILYSISPAARRTLHPPKKYVGQVAGPCYRGVAHLAPVVVISSRRARP
jgi:hypothetical protein